VITNCRAPLNSRSAILKHTSAALNLPSDDESTRTLHALALLLLCFYRTNCTQCTYDRSTLCNEITSCVALLLCPLCQAGPNLIS
jgi:hypothetical protein